MQKKKVLIVEDETDVAELARSAIESDDIEVFTAFDGLSAMDEVPRIQPDLLLLDVMLPTVDGFDLCKRIKDNPETEGMLVILCTAANEAFIIERVIAVGADDYITKPIDGGKLNEKIRAALGLDAEGC
jgi:DNA-binding response OmpR family regulator